jgi:hypothetical protein
MGTSPEPPRSTSDRRSEVLRGGSGEVPVWFAGRSGAGWEGKGAKGWAFGEPSWVWRAQRKAGDGRLFRRGKALSAFPGCRKLPPTRYGQESLPLKTAKNQESVGKCCHSNRLRDPPGNYTGGSCACWTLMTESVRCQHEADLGRDAREIDLSGIEVRATAAGHAYLPENAYKRQFLKRDDGCGAAGGVSSI